MSRISLQSDPLSVPVVVPGECLLNGAEIVDEKYSPV